MDNVDMELSSTASNSDVTVNIVQAIQGELTLLCSELKEKKNKKPEILDKKLEDISIAFKEDLRKVRNEITNLK